MDIREDGIWLNPVDSAKAILGSQLGSDTERHPDKAANLRQLNRRLTDLTEEITKQALDAVRGPDSAAATSETVATGLAVSEAALVMGAIQSFNNHYPILTDGQRDSLFDSHPNLRAIIEQQSVTGQ